jgi:hypothetical protein
MQSLEERKKKKEKKERKKEKEEDKTPHNLCSTYCCGISWCIMCCQATKQ